CSSDLTCVYKFFKKKEKEFLVEADRVVSLTHAAKDEILKWDLVSSNDQIAVIPCCTDLSLFDPETVQNSGINHLKTELNLEGCYPVVGYIGSTGTWYLLEDMLLYFKLLRQQFPSAVFLILTFDHPQTIYQNAEFMEIPSTALRVKSVHRKLLPQYMSLFDWSVFFI